MSRREREDSMTRRDRRISEAGRNARRREAHRTEGIAQVSGRVTGAEPDGRIAIVVNGRDCVSGGPIDSRAVGDGAVFSRLERVEGPAAAPGQVTLGSGPPAMPVITSVDPDVWPVNGTTDVLAEGYSLDEVQALALRLDPPFETAPYPDVVVDAFYPGFSTVPTGDPEIDGPPDPEVMLMTVTVADVLPTEERGAATVDKDVRALPDEPRSYTPNLYNLGPPATPKITAIEVLWSDLGVFEIQAAGTNLGAIDTVQFTHPQPVGGFDFIDSAVVTVATATTLTIQVTKGDEFPDIAPNLPFWEADSTRLSWVTVPQEIDFGIGGLQYTSTPLWLAHPPIEAIQAWLFMPEDFPFNGLTIPAGLYAAPMFADPSQPGAVPLPGRSYALPAPLPLSNYSPSGTAAANGYTGRRGADWYGGGAGLLVMYERGDALPDGGSGTGNNWGVGTGVWWQAWRVLDGVLEPAQTWPGENRLIGPFSDGAKIYGVTYLQGSGGQLVTADLDGGAATTGPRNNTGNPPHDPLEYDGAALVAMSWQGVGVPNEAQSWNLTTGGKSTLAYSTIDATTAAWDQELRGAPAKLFELTRVGVYLQRARPFDYAAGTDTNNWAPSFFPDTALPSGTKGGKAAGVVASVGRIPGFGGDPDTVLLTNLDAPGDIVVAKLAEADSDTILSTVTMGRTTPGFALALAAYPPDILPDGVT